MSIISTQMSSSIKNGSWIRRMFEAGIQLKQKYGDDAVCDFSLGNPDLAPPPAVGKALVEFVKHVDEPFSLGYMPNNGFGWAREKLAAHLSKEQGVELTANDVILTCGAAGALNVIFRTVLEPGDEVLTVAPFFGEYRFYVSNHGGTLHPVPCRAEDFGPDVEALAAAVTPRTRALIINSPNNPSGVVYSRETLERLAAILTEKSRAYGHPIYLISDEPYREIVFSGFQVPWIPQLYPDTIVCYSFSKSLSLPGERLGYVLVPASVTDSREVYAAVAGAGRSLGYVNAPSLFQQVTSLCCDLTSDLAVYERNAKLLVPALREMGYHCVEPGGAFYLFPRSLEPDDMAFSERAKQFDLLLVPGSGFGAPGHVRIAYCVQTDMIQRALPKFKALADSYR